MTAKKSELELLPPDDSGSDTYSRFQYQADIAFPFCLTLGNEIKSVVLEYFEDLALEYNEGWRFIQIKTKNAGLGPWILSDLHGKGGALVSLFRAYSALNQYHPATYEAHLEGAIRQGNDINLLLEPEGRRNKGLITKVAKGLSISEEQCADFLNKVRLEPNQPDRRAIKDRNLNLLAALAPSASAKDIETVYIDLLNLIKAAMSAGWLTNIWPRFQFSPETDSAKALLEHKRLTHESVKPILRKLHALETKQFDYINAVSKSVGDILRRRLLPNGPLLKKITPSFIPMRLHRGAGRSILQSDRTEPTEKITGVAGVLEDLQAEEINVAFLLGKAGSGKSTLLAEFCQELCQRFLTSAASQRVWPYWIPCPDLIHSGRNFQSDNLWLNGPIALLLDGLDEVADNDQPDVARKLSELFLLARRTPGSFALVTCRSEEIARFQSLVRLRQIYPSYTLCPPDESDRRELFLQIAYAMAGTTEVLPELAPDYIEQRLQKTEDYFQGTEYPQGTAFETPLLLSLFAVVILSRPETRSFPLVRRDLFAESCKVLMGQRLADEQFPRVSKTLQAIAEMFYLHGEMGQPTATKLERDELLAMLKRSDSLRDMNNDDLNLAQSSGLLVSDYGQVRFLHRSFIEYFVSLKIEAELLDHNDLTKRLFSLRPLTENIELFLLDLDNSFLFPSLRETLGSTRGRSFADVGYRGGNAINLLVKGGSKTGNLELKDAVLAGANLRGADLRRKDFGTADLRYADYSYAKLDGADWSRISFIGHLQIEEGGEIRSLAYSPRHGKIYAGDALGQIIVLDRSDLRPIQRVVCHRHSVTAVSLDDRNGWLISAGYDEHCQIQDARTLETLARVPQNLPKCRALASYSSREGLCYFVCGNRDDMIFLYRAITLDGPTRMGIELLQQQKVAGSPYRSISWSIDGNLVLIGGFDGKISWFRFNSEAKDLEPIMIDDTSLGASTVWGTSISDDGRYAATFDDEASLVIWNTEEFVPQVAKIIRQDEVGVRIGRCVYIDTRRLAVYVGADDGTIIALNIEGSSPQIIWRQVVHSDSVYMLRLVNGDNDLVSCSLDGRVVMMEPGTGKVRLQFEGTARDPYEPRLSIIGLRIRRDLVEKSDRYYLERRGVVFVEPKPPM